MTVSTFLTGRKLVNGRSRARKQVVTVRLLPDVYQRLRAVAAEHRVSLEELCRAALSSALCEMERGGQPAV